jgi:thiamine-phosphate pyrophosphorylase
MKPDFRLYLITDRKLFHSSEEMLKAMEKALDGGIRAVQLREKDLNTRELLSLAYEVRELTKRFGARLFVNDRVDIALAAGADGVHLGETGMPVRAARKASDGGLIIGVSTHGIDEARKAQEDGADFITLGPVYETPSKMRYGKPIGIHVLRGASGALSLPVYAIGGIRIDRIKEILQQGAYGIALISAILTAEDVRKTTEEFMRELS